MTSAIRTSSWTGSNGAAWNLSSGSWVHNNSRGTPTAITEDIQSNAGRCLMTAPASGNAARRRHLIDAANFQPQDLYIYAEWVGIGYDSTSGPGMFARQITSNTTNTHIAFFPGTNPKSSGWAIYTVVGGTATQQLFLSGMTGHGSGDTLACELWVVDTPGGLTLITSRVQVVGGDQCAVAAPSSLEAGDSATVSNGKAFSIAYVLSHATFNSTTGRCGLLDCRSVGAGTQTSTWDNLTVEAQTFLLGARTLSRPRGIASPIQEGLPVAKTRTRALAAASASVERQLVGATRSRVLSSGIVAVEHSLAAVARTRESGSAQVLSETQLAAIARARTAGAVDLVQEVSATASTRTRSRANATTSEEAFVVAAGRAVARGSATPTPEALLAAAGRLASRGSAEANRETAISGKAQARSSGSAVEVVDALLSADTRVRGVAVTDVDVGVSAALQIAARTGGRSRGVAQPIQEASVVASTRTRSRGVLQLVRETALQAATYVRLRLRGLATIPSLTYLPEKVRSTVAHSAPTSELGRGVLVTVVDEETLTATVATGTITATLSSSNDDMVTTVDRPSSGARPKDQTGSTELEDGQLRAVLDGQMGQAIDATLPQ